MIDRDLGGVGVIDILPESRLQYVRKPLPVFLGETIGRAFRRRRFEIVEIAGFLLIGDQLPAHMIQDVEAQLNSALVGDVIGIAREIPDHFVHAVDADRGEMIAEEGQVAGRIGIEAAVVHFLREDSFLLKRGLGDVHQPVDFLY